MSFRRSFYGLVYFYALLHKKGKHFQCFPFLVRRKGLEESESQQSGGLLHSPVRTLGNSSVSAAGRNANESLPAFRGCAAAER